MEIINKYDAIHKQLIQPYIYGSVNKNVFNHKLENPLTIDEIGLYVFLITRAGRIFSTNGEKISFPSDVKSLYKAIYKQKKLSGSYKNTIDSIKEMLDHLTSKDLIRLKQIHGIECVELTEIKEQAYARIYPMNTQIIIKKCKGKALLRRLAVYAAFRSMIFEGKNGNKIIEKPIAYMATLLGIPKSTMETHIKWLRDNYVIAYFKCSISETKAPEKIIYADIMDCIILKENIKYKLAKGHIKEVLE